MPGFTAINARSTEAQSLLMNSNAPAGSDPNSGQQKSKRRQPARKTAATSNDPKEDMSPTTTTTENTTHKRISGEGRKRKFSSNDNTQPKRQKNGRVQLNMSTTKPGVNATTTSEEYPTITPDETSSSSTDLGGLSATSKAKLDTFRYNVKQAATGDATRPDWSRPLPVYTSQTPTSITQQSQLQTTMRAVRNSSRGASLIYSSSATLPYLNAGVQTSRPPSSVTSRTKVPASGTIMPSSSNGQLTTPINSDPLVQSPEKTLSHGNGQLPASSSTQTLSLPPSTLQRDESTDYFSQYSDEDVEELIELANEVENPTSIEKSNRPTKSPPSRDWKLNVREVHENEDCGGALLSKEERNLLATLKPAPNTLKPIVRPPFPRQILDRTSLTGLSAATLLRTCFRVGEAINTGSHATRTNQNVILELYARITKSWREPTSSRKQHFVIHDLYHDKPPFLNGTFELWDQSALWDEHIRPFLAAGDGENGMKCRMIARMKRDGTKWRLEILNVRQAEWEEVEHVAGIIQRPRRDEMG